MYWQKKKKKTQNGLHFTFYNKMAEVIINVVGYLIDKYTNKICINEFKQKFELKE